MKVFIRKWGNRAATCLPEVFLDQMDLKIGSYLEAEINDGALKLRRSKPKYLLADLMAEMPNGFPVVEGWNDLPFTEKETPSF